MLYDDVLWLLQMLRSPYCFGAVVAAVVVVVVFFEAIVWCSRIPMR